MKGVWVLGLVCLCGLIGSAALAAPVIRMPSKMSIELPPSERTFQPGPNLGVVRANCLVCHNADYVYNQTPMTRAQWTAEVNKMRNVYKATIADDDVAKIVDYLMSQNGKS
ncbi:MAG: cytochrome c [Candidatus Eremiobacteraeota bacterium]|nr:cytochrome c [Candidatus Eremiobacteraeota bacterium]